MTQPSQPFTEGYNAGRKAILHIDYLPCPYPICSDEALEWREGFNIAFNDYCMEYTDD